MLRSLSILIAAGIVVSACAPEAVETSGAEVRETVDAVSDEALSASAIRIRDDMAYLASDELEGREAGTEGYEKAAAYVAGTLEDLGIDPAGDEGSYYQTVPLQRSYRDPEAGKLTITDDAGEQLGLEANVDYVVYTSTTKAQSDVEAPAVFAGYGIVAPELGRDDYEGLDVEGKVVFLFSGTPSGIQTEERAYYGGQKSVNAYERGAVGLVYVPTPTREEIYSFQRLVSEGRLETASMTWIGPDGEPYSRSPGLQASARLSPQGARTVFEAAGRDFDAIQAAAEAEGGLIEGFELPFEVSLSQGSVIDTVESDNVVGMIEGSDPELRDEVIVLTAHLDHLGVLRTFESDRINNGAIDNAAGVATLLEVGRMLSAGEPPRRSVLFLFVTAEEKGLLGSQYFAQNPTVPVEQIVGTVNLDMPVLTYDFQDVVAFGADRSTISDAVRKAAEDTGISLSPDPFPEQGIFTRSDHFRFVEIGVPAVKLATGFANGGEAAWADHYARTYHRPADDMDNNLNFEAAARFAEINLLITQALANADERPLWRKDDFFAEQFGGPQETE